MRYTQTPTMYRRNCCLDRQLGGLRGKGQHHQEHRMTYGCGQTNGHVGQRQQPSGVARKQHRPGRIDGRHICRRPGSTMLSGSSSSSSGGDSGSGKPPSSTALLYYLHCQKMTAQTLGIGTRGSRLLALSPQRHGRQPLLPVGPAGIALPTPGRSRYTNTTKKVPTWRISKNSAH